MSFAVSLVTQSCLTLCDSMDCSLPGSSVHGILQARLLEWVAMPSFRGSYQPGIEPRSPEFSPSCTEILKTHFSHQSSPYLLVILETSPLPSFPSYSHSCKQLKWLLACVKNAATVPCSGQVVW